MWANLFGETIPCVQNFYKKITKKRSVFVYLQQVTREKALKILSLFSKIEFVGKMRDMLERRPIDSALIEELSFTIKGCKMCKKFAKKPK
jgi:hypothetical protein